VGKKILELAVGIFILAGIVALFILAFKVSGISEYGSHNTFAVVAEFDNIGDLKVRAPVTIAGVRVGEISDIDLNTKTFRARVKLIIDRTQKIPLDTSASILTAGLIGANYIELNPGFAEQNLSNGGEITETHPAIILENLIGKFIYQLKNEDEKEENNKSSKRGKK
jgi:phospholipid/cholesterol/gamma-HCH transport system substrate-binding protein